AGGGPLPRAGGGRRRGHPGRFRDEFAHDPGRTSVTHDHEAGLGADARSIIDAARAAEDPSGDDVARVRGKIFAHLGLAAAGGAVATLASTAAAEGAVATLASTAEGAVATATVSVGAQAAVTTTA